MITVTWTVDLFDDKLTPEQAALTALEYIRDVNSLAHVFEVTTSQGKYTVDLDEDPEDRVLGHV